MWENTRQGHLLSSEQWFRDSELLHLVAPPYLTCVFQCEPEFRHPEEYGEGTLSFNYLSHKVTHFFSVHIPLVGKSRKKMLHLCISSLLGRGQAGEEKFWARQLILLIILHLDKGAQIPAVQLCLPCVAWCSCISLSQKLSSGALAESSDDRSIEES